MGIPVASLALGAIGTGISAIGSIEQGQATAAAARYQAQVASNNQIIAQQQAQSAAQAGEAAAETQSLKTREEVAAAAAGAAANGMEPNSGSASDTQKSMRLVGNVNALNAQQQGEMSAYGFNSQATGFGAQSALDTAEASSAATAGFIGGASSLLGGASTVGSRYYWMTQNGALGGNAPSTDPWMADQNVIG